MVNTVPSKGAAGRLASSTLARDTFNLWVIVVMVANLTVPHEARIRFPHSPPIKLR